MSTKVITNSAVRTFVGTRNAMRQLFKQPVIDSDRVTDEQLEQLLYDVETDLSPENLTCDGELRGAALQHKAKFLREVQVTLQAMLKEPA